MTSTQPSPTLESIPAALADFTSALGAERVLTSEEDLATFRDPFQYRAGTTTRPPRC